MDWEKGHSINEWIFSQTEIFSSKCEGWIRLSNYATESDLKNETGVDISDFVKKTCFS